MVIPANESPWLAAYEQLIREFEEQSGATVDLRKFPYEELRSQYINDIQQESNTFDLYQVNEANTGEFYQNGWYQPLNDIDPQFTLDDEVLSYADIAYWNTETRANDPEAELMSFPLNGNVALYMYRSDILDDLGVEAPETWEDVIEVGQRIEDEGLSTYGFVYRMRGAASGTGITYEFMQMFYSAGADWFREAGTDWTPTVNTPEGIRAAEILRELAELGPSATTTIGQAEAIAMVQSGEAAQIVAVAAVAPQFESESNSNVVGQMGYAAIPGTADHGPGAVSGIFSLGVPVGLDDERSECAVQYIDWLQSEEAQIKFGQFGGIPSREDALLADGYDQATTQYFTAIAESREILRPHLRFEFGERMTRITEPILEAIAAGDLSPVGGMNQMQDELTALVEDLGPDYPMTGP